MVSASCLIDYLADHPEALPFLERLFLDEWPGYYGHDGPGNAQTDLLAYANRRGLPVGLVALIDSVPCGVAALKTESISTHRHLSPWIGGAVVVAHMRRQGIGAQLVAGLEDVARTLGYASIYSGTASAGSLLDRAGWQFMERIQYNGEQIGIYQKDL